MSVKNKSSDEKYVPDDENVDEEVLQKQKQEMEGVYKYTHLSGEERTLVDLLLRGNLELDEVPRVRSNVVKMFISSTFVDMEAERNALVEEVYPKLRELCRNEYGVDFHPVDMRWGVPMVAGDDHSAVDMCLSELRHCQDSSLGPNFVALIGQRYGWVPLPSAILRAEYEAIEAHVRTENTTDADILSTCFRKDQNVHPNVYRLQPVSYITETIKKPWIDVEVDLKRIIKIGGKLAVEASEVSRAYYRELKSSVTEHEIYHGLIGISKQNDRDNNAILYIRDFQDIHRNLQSKKASSFINVVGSPPEIESEIKAAIDEIKTISQGKLPPNNYLKSSISWKDSGIDQRFHQPYLQRMCNHFLNITTKLVHRNLSKKAKLNNDSLYYETLQHWNTLKTRCKTFVGRAEELSRIKQYIQSNSTQPLVVYGPSGSGKTALLAKAADMVKGINASVIVRFLGTTPKSSSIQQLLYSVCHQLAYITKTKRSEVPEDFVNLKIYFRDMVLNGEFPGKVVIVLDALNQMSTSLQGHKLDWLPARHASKIRIIVSTLPMKLDILDRLRHKIHDNFLEVKPPPFKDCEEIFNILMENANRKISYEQWKWVRKAFQSCTLPLFVILTFEEAKKWCSYDLLHEDYLKSTVEESINQLFDRLETKHGQLFVARALGYMTAAKNGLSEAELEDILSLDDDVLNSIFLFWVPPIRRLPPSLLSRLHFDIHPFLVDRDADGTPVISWYHQQFENVVKERYLSDYMTVMEIHRTIEQYYMGSWAGVKKSFKYTPQLMQRLKVHNANGSAIRCVPKQPMLFESEDRTRYNVRKLNQVPYSMLHSRQLSRLKAKCLCNYEWIFCKLKATSLPTLLADYSLIEDKECSLIASALRMAGPALAIDPQALVPELTGRLLPHCGNLSFIKQLVGQCDHAAQYYCSLIPNCQIYNSPGGPLQYERHINASASSRIDVDVFPSPNGVLMTAKSFYNQIVYVWEMSDGEPRQELKIPIGNIYPSSDGKYLSTFKNNRFVLVYKSDGGELHGEVDYDYGVVDNVVTSDRLLVFITDRGDGPFIVDVDECILLHRFSYNCSACAIDSQESSLVLSAQKQLYLYGMPSMEKRCAVTMEEDVKLLKCITGQQKCFALTESNLLYSITFDLLTMEAEVNDIISDYDIKDFTLSHSENLLLIRASRCLYLIDVKQEDVKHRLQKMPEGMFVETMSTFSSAGFTPKDDMVVASRYTYIAVWDTKTGEPIRLLLASVSPIVRIFTCSTLNKTVSLLKNHTLQVWDMDNLHADVQHANMVLRAGVEKLCVSSHSKRIVCCGDKLPPEVVVVDSGSCKAQKVVPYSKERDDAIHSLEMSPLGKYCVIRGKRSSDTTAPIISKILFDDLIYDIATLNTFYIAQNNRYVIFDRTSSYIACIQCLSYVPFDWIGNSYVLKLFQPKHFSKEPKEFRIPESSEFVCKPLIYSSAKLHAFISVYQTCEAVVDRLSRIERGRYYETKLSVLNIITQTEKTLKVKTLLPQCDINDKFVDARMASTKKLVVLYAKNVEYFKFDVRCGLVCPPNVEKGFIVYDPETDYMLRHMPSVLLPSIHLPSCMYSKQGSIVLSEDLQVFKNITKGYLTTITTEVISGSAKLALDGQYIVALCKSGKTILVIKSGNGEIVGKLFVHGQASCLQVAEDDRTVVVGCNDGRVMILTLILDSKDPVNELIVNLDTRKTKSMADTLKLLDRDVIKSNFKSEATGPRKPPNFKSVSKSIALAQRAGKLRSQACCIQ